MLGSAGVTLMACRTAEVTVKVLLPDTAPDVAVMVAEPTATDVAIPLLPTVATEVDDELQVTDAVRSWLELSE